MTKKLTAIGTAFLLAIGCASTSDCPDKINLLPMFGGQKKCQEQIDADKEFFHWCDSIFPDRKAASQHHINRGWDYFYANILDTSMMRFNQAWLLDSTNADAYWGFGNLLGRQKKYKESLIFFDKSVKLNPDNSKVWHCASLSYGQIFFETKDMKQLNTGIEYSKKAVQLDSTNASAYGQLTALYAYFMQKDSANKYLKITDRLDPTQINPEVRKIVTGK
ncbi:MAG: tetratricopeptide repeat protein [bacterium]|nr:tetratricopeptide repeat protein [bacterium]